MKTNVTGLIYGIIGVVVLCLVVAALVPTLNTGVSTIGNISGLPLASLFAKNGILILIFIAAIILAIIAALGFGKKH
jgi:hypothetical protein